MFGKRYKMRMDIRAWIATIFAFAVAGAVVYYLYISSGASYLPAWFAVFILTVGVLLGLSIPRYVALTKTSLEIHCLVELTVIPIGEILSVKQLTKRDMSWTVAIPFLGAWGVFGYYGYYYDFRTLRRVKLYASRWSRFVQIEYAKDKFIIVSCQQPDELLSDLKEAIKESGLNVD